MTDTAKRLAIAQKMATLRGYSPAEIDAGVEHWERLNGRANPPGSFDAAGRFKAEERTKKTTECRAPSREWPYSQMKAARTADHCAEVHGAENLTNVRRVKRLIDTLMKQPQLSESAHTHLSYIRKLKK